MNTIIVIVVYAILLCVDYSVVRREGDKRLSMFYLGCTAISFVVIFLHVQGTVLVGPSQLILDVARALSLVE